MYLLTALPALFRDLGASKAIEELRRQTATARKGLIERSESPGTTEDGKHRPSLGLARKPAERVARAIKLWQRR
jgi:hypothetical protein